MSSKTRHFVDGAVIGSKNWVNEVVEGLKNGWQQGPRDAQPKPTLVAATTAKKLERELKTLSTTTIE